MSERPANPSDTKASASFILCWHAPKTVLNVRNFFKPATWFPIKVREIRVLFRIRVEKNITHLLKHTFSVFANKGECLGTLLGIPVAISVVEGIADILFRNNRRALGPGCVLQGPTIRPVISLVILSRRSPAIYASLKIF